MKLASIHLADKFFNLWTESLEEAGIEEDLYNDTFDLLSFLIVNEVTNFPHYHSILSLRHYPSFDSLSESSFKPLTVSIAGFNIPPYEITFQLINLLSSHSDISLHF